MNYEDFTAAELDEAYAEIAQLLNERRGPSQPGCVQVDPGLYVVHHDKQYANVPMHFVQHNHVMSCEKDSCWGCYKIAKEHLIEFNYDICIKVMFSNPHKSNVICRMLIHDLELEY